MGCALRLARSELEKLVDLGRVSAIGLCNATAALLECDRLRFATTHRRGDLGYSRVLQGTPGYSRALQGIPGYSRVLQGTPGYSTALYGTPKCWAST